MDNFDYRTRFTFQTVFYKTAYTYCCCSCGFQHEFMLYIDDSGAVNEEIFEKIVQNIIDGKCPHVTDKIPAEWLKDTSISGAQIAAAVGTELPENGKLKGVYEESLRADQGIFNVELCAMSLIKKKFDKVSYHYKKYVRYNRLIVGSSSILYCTKGDKRSDSAYVITPVPFFFLKLLFGLRGRLC